MPKPLSCAGTAGSLQVKQSRKIPHIKPKKISGHYKYTVVSAVYNIGRYLDDYFKSLESQRLDFKKHIYLVLVDDGSTDSSAQIIKRWQEKYPNNITYVWKENGGQASARNLGMQYVKTDWVTFIDPDDFIESSYFLSVDTFLSKSTSGSVDMISTNLKFYFEETDHIKDTHPLRGRFTKGDVAIGIRDLHQHIQLSASTAFFRTSLIRRANIHFHDIRPSFEDAHFVALYMSEIVSGKVAFLKSAVYFYRKRADGTSTLDTSWQKPSLFNEVLKNGCLDAMYYHEKKHGFIPNYLQRAVLYHLIWYIKRIVNNDNSVSFLSEDQKEKLLTLLLDIFSKIDEKTILSFNLAGCWFYHKVGMLAAFKKIDPNFQIVYIDSLDKFKNLLCLRYFSRTPELESINIDGVDTLPVYAKTIKHNFLSELFLLERRLWIQLPSNGKLSIKVNGQESHLSLNGHQYKSGIECRKVIDTLSPTTFASSKSQKYQDSWLFMDRDVQADDNAEHLYRYVRKNHPERKIYFCLRRESHDWNRLKHENFNLVEFGTSIHEDILRGCSKLISSHADRYVTNYLGAKMLQGRHFVFLQHGVIQNDLSGWLNQKEQIDCFVTATKKEYLSITNDNTRYKYGKKDVVLTGLPRHDALLSKEENTENMILIMPTWRQSVVGKSDGNGNNRLLNPDFMKTAFAEHWVRILQSKELRDLTSQYGYRVVFFPHANIQPYLSQMAVPAYIEVVCHANRSIQDLFVKAKLMVTDYSSVAFDMAVQNKGVIYYQFDESDMLSGAHTFDKGYFDYRRDGFGPVVIDEISLFKTLQITLESGGTPTAEYKARIEATFPFRDGKNCQRTYEAITNLDQPLPDEFVDHEILVNYAEQASKFYHWPLAEKRWVKVEELGGDSLKLRSRLKQSEALLEQGRVDEARAILELVAQVELTPEERNELTLQYAKLAIKCKNWSTAVTYLQSLCH